MHNQGELMCLVKPLFEIDDANARRTGEIGQESYLPLLLHLVEELNAQPFTWVENVTHSPVTGNNGTHEFFLHVRFGSINEKPDLAQACQAAVERAVQLEKYHKR
jgi:23S rRNA (cytidine1920-2'-O)/16S rRNA (cytidine1409-2'-O)-methyltransferase